MSSVNFKHLSREMEGAGGRGSSIILFLISILVIFFIFWANYAELDNVIRGDGRVVSSVQNQTVQASEGGVILRRYVSENSTITSGDLLFEIDPVDASSELNQAKQRILTRNIRELRLRAEIAGLETFTTPENYHLNAPTVALSEESLFAAKRLELKGRISVLEQRVAQKMQDIIASTASLESLSRTMGLLNEEIDVVEPLVKEKIAPATQLLDLQRQLEQARGSKDRASASIQQAYLTIEELEKEIENAEADYGLKSMEELNKVIADKLEIEKAIPRLQDRVSRTVIKAPMDGIVNKIFYRTPGGFIRTGDPVLEFVPTGEALIVEGRIAPQDISKIAVGDEVRIRFSAYDSSKYGHVMGEVDRISADAELDERSGASHYLIDVLIAGELVIDEEPVEFLPGMTASVDVLSGKRTVFEYLWQPVSSVGELALRD